MRVQDIMSDHVQACRLDESLNRAAQIMWEHDCGAVPVVDADSHVVGMVTDRDICMAVYTQGRTPGEIPVAAVCSHAVLSCRQADSVHSAESLMRIGRVHRLPVVDDDGKLCGVVSLADLVRSVHRVGRQADGLSHESVATTLAAISQPRSRSGHALWANRDAVEAQHHPAASA